ARSDAIAHRRLRTGGSRYPCWAEFLVDRGRHEACAHPGRCRRTSRYTVAMNTPHDSALGRETSYPHGYDPTLLFPIPRAQGRSSLGLGETLPFHGVDIWNGYELSWLEPL